MTPRAIGRATEPSGPLHGPPSWRAGLKLRAQAEPFRLHLRNCATLFRTSLQLSQRPPRSASLGECPRSTVPTRAPLRKSRSAERPPSSTAFGAANSGRTKSSPPARLQSARSQARPTQDFPPSLSQHRTQSSCPSSTSDTTQTMHRPTPEHWPRCHQAQSPCRASQSVGGRVEARPMWRNSAPTTFALSEMLRPARCTEGSMNAGALQTTSLRRSPGNSCRGSRCSFRFFLTASGSGASSDPPRIGTPCNTRRWMAAR